MTTAPTRRLLLLSLLAMATHLHAQGVYKCGSGAGTTYQSSPCPTGGQAVDIKPGPTPDQVQQARAHAAAEQARVGTVAAPAAATRPLQPVPRGADCAQLNATRANAYGNRNAAVRSSRNDNIDRSAAVTQQMARIQSAEGQMNRAGCKFD